jgi:hypothetical protein
VELTGIREVVPPSRRTPLSGNTFVNTWASLICPS